jgi:hypothetical protein
VRTARTSNAQQITQDLFANDPRRYPKSKCLGAVAEPRDKGECGHLYDFRQLSPADFEDLTRDLLQQEWGVRLEAVKTGRYQGIDLRYAAILGESTIIQCKHYAGSTVAKLVQALRTKERTKIERLAPTRYVLVTSPPLSPADKNKLLAVLHPFAHGPHDVLGAHDLNNLLGRHANIEAQHFKLWMSSTTVLQQVLHNATRVQTEFDVQRVLRNIPLYVQTSNYERARKILTERRDHFRSTRHRENDPCGHATLRAPGGRISTHHHPGRYQGSQRRFSQRQTASVLLR